MTPLSILAACALSAAIGALVGWLLKPSHQEIVIERAAEWTDLPCGVRERHSWSSAQVGELLTSRAEERRQAATREADLLALIHDQHLVEATARQSEARAPWLRRARA